MNIINNLKKHKSFSYTGIFHYLIAYDYMAGSKDRYTVFILNSDDPITVGRELDISNVCSLIKDYEECGKQIEYIGERKDVLKCHNYVIMKRRNINK